MNDQPGQTSGLITEIIASLAIIRFNQPTTRNSLSQQVLEDLRDAVSTLKPRDDIDSLVFTGTGDVFASGADIRELTKLDPEKAVKFSETGQQLFQMIAEARQVTIAAINGYCMGGALDLALACDIRVASSRAVFAHPGAGLGIITGWGGTQRLPRIVGRARALEILVTSRRLTSDEALEIGLVTRIHDPVLECALELARQAHLVLLKNRAMPL